MAKVLYDANIADNVIIKFKCNCGEEITTELIPVLERYDLNKDVNSFTHDKKIVCSRCKEEYLLYFYDDMNSSYCEIPSIVDDKNIIYLHEIPYEYAKDYDNALLEYITEIVKLKDFMEKSKEIEVFDKSTLYKMALIYSIAIMDAFLGNTFRYYVMKYERFKMRFVKFRWSNKKVSNNEIIKYLNSRSFQNLKYVVIPYYKNTFDVKISFNNTIQSAVNIRNTIIHNSGRENDGYENIVSDSDVMNVINEINQLVTSVYYSILDTIFEEVIWPSQKKKKSGCTEKILLNNDNNE